jgi:hypothetical protein
MMKADERQQTCDEGQQRTVHRAGRRDEHPCSIPAS